MTPTRTTLDQATFITSLSQAAIEALDTLRAVMAHARTAAAEPLPKSLEKARIAAAKVLHIASKMLLGAPSVPASAPKPAVRPDPHRIPTDAEIDALIAKFRKGLPPSVFQGRSCPPSPIPVAGSAQPRPPA